MAIKLNFISFFYLFFYVTILSLIAADETKPFSSTYSAKSFSKNVTQLLDGLLANYDRRIRPGHGGPPTPIDVNMNVRSMGPFSEKFESYAMQLYMRQVWYDPRLRFHKDLWGRSEFSMNWKIADKLWKPDTFFINGKNSNFHRITTPNMFIRLRYDGQITWSMRLTVRATCLMHLRKFPLDTQQCPLKMASYGYNAQNIIYRWDPLKLVTVDPDVSLAQYELINITTSDEKVIIRRTEQISTLTVKFHLRRETGFFLLQVYIPCILIVCCSWVAFWITKKDVPGRVALGVTTVLSMTTLGFGGRTTGPPVSYATALDYFVILCFAFVFAAVLEFAFINFVERAATKRRKKMDDLRREIIERIKEGSGTMLVTTTVEEGTPIVKDTLRQFLKVPLTVVPFADDEAIIEVTNMDEPQPGNVQEGMKALLKVPLTVLPESTDAVNSANDVSETTPLSGEPSSTPGTPQSSKARKRKTGETEVTKKKKKKNKSEKNQKKRKGSDDKIEKEIPSIIVDISDDEEEEPPPPHTITIWQLLMQKRKLMVNMAPSFIIPAEDDILDRFSIVDIYARRIFPALFFTFISVYWILFNYYITDEFPELRKKPSDGLIVT